MIYQSCLKELRLANARNFSVVCMTRKLCCANENPKDGLGLQTDTRKSAYGNRIQ